MQNVNNAYMDRLENAKHFDFLSYLKNKNRFECKSTQKVVEKRRWSVYTRVELNDHDVLSEKTVKPTHVRVITSS